MTDESGKQRHSVADEAYLIQDEKARAEAEALNGLRQFDAAVQLIESHLDPEHPNRINPERPFKLRVSHILSLHRIALDGIHAYAGNFRPAGVAISGSKHEPIGAHIVPDMVEELCDYVNDNWKEKSPIHLAAYVMWRLNWIHPFSDGNGRTSRVLSYVVLCLRAAERFPGDNTIPEQIEKDRQPYFDALDAADAAYKDGHIDVAKMEELLDYLLSEQLLSALHKARGADGQS
ncbi:Fic family protein [Azospirillum rugosum]|uniref:Fic family protein n=1 Tax=Azospirillum rugosum TaxID=416170 RepID=A0ABS4SNS1_9PROT|nr:Fic family protein [Azospirillum rugosum]MBP2294210.1 Fic family protein [Azospirillum rugosum]MDQ0527401.1 Fic family protein [Azospirillum rugosum]